MYEWQQWKTSITCELNVKMSHEMKWMTCFRFSLALDFFDVYCFCCCFCYWCIVFVSFSYTQNFIFYSRNWSKTCIENSTTAAHFVCVCVCEITTANFTFHCAARFVVVVVCDGLRFRQYSKFLYSCST